MREHTGFIVLSCKRYCLLQSGIVGTFCWRSKDIWVWVLSAGGCFGLFVCMCVSQITSLLRSSLLAV